MSKISLYTCRCISKDNTEPGKMVDFCASKVDGECPCGLKVADPRNCQTIFERERIHFDGPTAFFGRGAGHAACDPKIKLPGPAGLMASGEPGAVTCPECRASQVWQECATRFGIPLVPTDADTDWIPPRSKASAPKTQPAAVPEPIVVAGPNSVDACGQ